MKWKYHITVKDLLSNVDISEPTEENKKIAFNIAQRVVSQLGILKNKTENSNINEEEIICLINEVEEVEGYFDFIKDLSSGKIDESDYEDYVFDGNFQNIINWNLSALYDLGDSRVLLKNGLREKYFWVK